MIVISDLSDSVNIYDDLCADSLDVMELMMEIEDHFYLSITDEEASGWETIKDIITTVERGIK
jgi:acyl carrier protein